MNYKEFITLIKSSLQDHLGTEYQLQEELITKPNNIRLNALIINSKQSNLTPCIYMDSFYESYQKGYITLNDIVEQILETYQSNTIAEHFDTNLFLDFNYSKLKLCGRLINTLRNKAFLEDAPHRNLLDLSLVYYMDFSSELHKDGCFIPIKNCHLTLWNITEEELYKHTIENMTQKDDAFLLNLYELAESMNLPNDSEYARNMLCMYLLTNQNKLYGAAQILNEKILTSAAKIIGTDFLILPSSQHEVLLIPANSESADLNDLADIVKYVNITQVATDEFLSDHIYHYDYKTTKITLAI